MSSGLVDFYNSRLREELKRLKISLAGAARAVGEPGPQRLKDIAGGRQRLPVDLLARLGALGVDVVYVMTGIESPPGVAHRLTTMFRVTADAEPDGGEITDSAHKAMLAVSARAIAEAAPEYLTSGEQALLDDYRACNDAGKQALVTTAAVMAQQATSDGAKGT